MVVSQVGWLVVGGGLTVVRFKEAERGSARLLAVGQ